MKGNEDQFALPFDRCVHCGGSGQLVTVDPKRPWVYNWAAGTKTPNAVAKPFTCNYCRGTGRAVAVPKERDG